MNYVFNHRSVDTICLLGYSSQEGWADSGPFFPGIVTPSGSEPRRHGACQGPFCGQLSAGH